MTMSAFEEQTHLEVGGCTQAPQCTPTNDVRGLLSDVSGMGKCAYVLGKKDII